MSRHAVLLLLALAGAVGTVGAADAPGTDGNATAAPTVEQSRVVSIYPNPVADGDRGEYVVVSVPLGTNLTGWTLGDGESTVALPNVTVSGRVALTTDPGQVGNLTDVRILALEGHLALANGGETVTVTDGAGGHRRVEYVDAPEGEVGRVANGTVAWEPLGATDFPVRAAGPGRVRTFVLPDAGGLPADMLASADDRILLAAYTFTSRRATDALVAAAERGVRVRVLVEGGPVGGMSVRQARLLDRLAANGVTVRVVDGPYASIDHHHAKYAVVDDRALVLTENWKPAGTGGADSRGWGVVLTQPALVADLTGTFRADAAGRGAVPWEQFRTGRTFEEGGRANGSYRRRYRPATHRATGASLLVAPDNAERAVIDRLDAAEESIAVVQVGVGGPNQSFVRALQRAAARGVEVRLLLSRAWYARAENRAVADHLEAWAAERNAPLSVRLARPRGRFGKIHAKGAVIDGETVLLGSLNWNDHSARQNREVVVAIEGEGPAGYYQRVFRGDWRAAVWRLSVGSAVAVVAAIALATIVARRIEFAPAESGVGPTDEAVAEAIEEGY